MVKPARFEVWLVRLDPTVGSEIRKTRPCVVVSPDDLNRALRTVIVAPLTSSSHDYPFRVPCTFKSVEGEIIIDQLRTVDAARLIKKLGKLTTTTAQRVSETLVEMFEL